MPGWSMYSSPLAIPFDPSAPPRQFRMSCPVWPLALLSGALALAAFGAWLGWLDPRVVRIVAVPSAHGTLLTVALASADPRWRRHAAVLTSLLAGAAVAARVSPWGALAYLAVPLALSGIGAREPRLAIIGLGLPRRWRTVLVGVAAGVFLGGHLLLSASRTFGYEVRVVPLDRYLVALAYDVGANVVSAECFFRGVLFNLAQRRWSFGVSAALATGAALARYLVDPAMPRAVETIVGAMFYLTLENAVSCGLFWWSGSLLPGSVAGLGFFAAYRALHG